VADTGLGEPERALALQRHRDERRRSRPRSRAPHAAAPWAEHLELPADEIPDDPTRAIDEVWKPISKEQLERRSNGLPLTHRLVRLPHVSKRTRRFLGPIDSLLVDG
jgi:hypothetical protein